MSIRYELSHWIDYPGATGMKEEKVNILAATGMDFAGRAQNISLKREHSGRQELTFELPVKYIDITTGEMIKNPLISKVVEKTKIKLWRDETWWDHFNKTWVQGRWYDFIVKSHSEKRSKKQLVYSYTCEALFINELSRNGYSLQFVADTDLMAANGMGTAHDLAARIVEGTDWEYIKTETFKDYKEEFNPVTGETVKTPVSTDQIEYIGGLERYGYCCELFADSTQQTEIRNSIKAQLEQYKFSSNVADDIISKQISFDEDGKMLWKPKASDEFKPYVYNYQKTDINVVSADVIYCADNGKQVYYIDNKEATEKTGLSLLQDSMKAWEYIDGTVEPVSTGNAGADDFSVQMRLSGVETSDNKYKSAIVYRGYDKALENGDMYAIRVATDTAAAITFEVYEASDSGYEQCKYQFDITPDISINAYSNTMLLSVVTRVSHPVFVIRAEGETKTVDISAIYIYKFTGNNKIINAALLQTLSSNIQSSSHLVTEVFANLKSFIENASDVNLANNLITYNDNTFSPIWARMGRISAEGYKSAAQEYVIEFNDGKAYTIYLPITENYNTKKLSSYDLDKRRAISGEKSNRFSLIETVAKTFHCFTRFLVEHNENGSIKTDGNGKPIKRFTFVSELGRKQFNGFNYGVNLESVERTLESENLITKMHVESIENQYSDSNMVTIQESQYNQLGMTYLYNFSYYINRGLLDKDRFLEDYNKLLSYVGSRTKAMQVILEKYSPMISEKSRLETALEINKFSQESILSLVKEKMAEIHWDYFYSVKAKDKAIEFPNITLSNLQDYEDSSDKIGYETYKDTYDGYKTYEASDTGKYKIPTRYHTVSDLAKYMEYRLIDGKTDFDDVSNYWSGQIGLANTENALLSIFSYQETYKSNVTKSANLSVDLAKIEEEVKEYENFRDKTNKEISSYIKRFENRYAQFIIEGQWPGSDYIDADTFYLDATRAHAAACVPKVSYSVGAIDFAKATNPYNPEDTDWGKEFIYDVGDISYVKDEELFGNTEQLVMIASITSEIDKNTQDKLELRNFETRFEEIFQQVAATVTNVELNENTWGKAANFMADGTINESILQSSIAKNNNLTIHSANNDVVTDNKGITIKDTANKVDVLRAVAGGIFFSNNGGISYRTGITADGMSASLVTAGRLDTSKIVIRDDENPLFCLDKLGLSAYTVGIQNKLTRFDRFGIYGTNKAALFGNDWWRPYETSNLKITPEEVIRDNSYFSLTKLGLNLRYEQGNLTFGTLGKINEKERFGLRIVDKEGNDKVLITDDGNAKFTGEIVAKSGKVGGWNIHDYILYAYPSNGGGSGFLPGNSEVNTPCWYAGYDKTKLQKIADDQNLGRTAEDYPNVEGITTNSWTMEGIVKFAVTQDGDVRIGRVNIGTQENPQWVNRFYYNATDGNLTIRGNIYANDGEFNGSISGARGTFKGNLEASNGKFKVVDGVLYANEGLIGGWDITSKALRYAPPELTKLNYSKGFINGAGKQDGGYSVGSSGNKDDWILWFGGDGKKTQGKFGVDKTGKLYCHGADISGKITADEGIIKNGFQVGSNGASEFYDYGFGSMWRLVGQITPCFVMDDDHISMVGDSGTTVTVERRDSRIALYGNTHVIGTLYTQSGTVEKSDKNAKNTISLIESQYNNVYDNLEPVTFKYNNGTSDRLHFGFIAQQIGEVLSQNNIDTKDFAPLCISNPDTENEQWGVRYTEFVALNTWQIQKLKARVADLEAKLDALTKA